MIFAKPQRLVVIGLLLAICVLTGCRRSVKPSPEGFIEVPGGKVWYRIVGSGNRPPLLLLAGGPGGRSCGLSPLAGLRNDRPVVFYDQLGSGKSDRPTDPRLWRTERFVEELAIVRQTLGLRKVHILGHSWGATLAAEYLLAKKPDGVVSVILSSPMLSTARWIADAKKLRQSLPQSVQVALEKCEGIETADEPACKEATEVFNQHFMWGMPTRPSIPDCEGVPPFNDDVYRYMWGPTEFSATGVLKDYDCTARLVELHLPVLFIAGRQDEATPDTVADFARNVYGARMVVLEKSAHTGFVTEQKQFIQTVRDFLRVAEGT